MSLDASLVKLIRSKQYSLKDIATKLKAPVFEIKELIKDLKLRGVLIYAKDGLYGMHKDPPLVDHGHKHVYTSRKDNSYVFGFMGDTHLGSKYERLDVLNDLYDLYELEGVDRVFHQGNWIEGECRLNAHDIKIHGMSDQMQYCVDQYPRKSFNTYAVTGDDHEGWWAHSMGVDIGQLLEDMMRRAGRKDWHNTGYMESYIPLKNANSGKEGTLLSMHPGGGSAYAISYRPQKIVESFSGGEKPNVLLIGHYHKGSYNMVRGVHAIQSMCFPANTPIQTTEGPKPISQVVIGDEVLTHNERYMPVTKTMVRNQTDGFYSMNYGRKGRDDQTLTATPEHPILIERDSERCWLAIEEIIPGDFIFINYSNCKICGNKIPFYNKICYKCTPMDLQETRDKISKTKGGVNHRERKNNNKHYINDILPACLDLQKQGWKIAPIGHVTPDAIGYKDGVLVAFEFEKETGRYLAFKTAKYNDADILKFVDEVRYINLKKRKEIQRGFNYEVDVKTGFIKVPVLSNDYHPQGSRQRTVEKVYNISVEEDESYVAGNVLVHNCTQDQTPFMRKKGLDAHVGGGICTLKQDPKTGMIYSCKVEFFQYFTKSKTNGRWGYCGLVNLPERGI